MMTHLHGLFLSLLMVFLLASSSFAIPAFSRKYDLSCTSCHTKPPRLNAFGEAFHMAGFQIPAVKEGETKKKRTIGRIWSETDFLNIFAFRANGNMGESFQGGNPDETKLTLPREVDLYLAGTLTDEISYFLEFDCENRVVTGIGGGVWEEKSECGVGKEFFLMFNLQSLRDTLIAKRQDEDAGNGWWRNGFSDVHGTHGDGREDRSLDQLFLSHEPATYSECPWSHQSRNH